MQQRAIEIYTVQKKIILQFLQDYISIFNHRLIKNIHNHQQWNALKMNIIMCITSVCVCVYIYTLKPSLESKVIVYLCSPNPK